MARHKNADWALDEQPGFPGAQLAALMDIRDELQEANRYLRRLTQRLDCHETLAIPRILRRISANTAKPRKRKEAPRG